MQLEQSFEVAAPVERVWTTLIDVQAVAPCLPGAEITSSDESGAYHGTFSVKIGPVTMAYSGALTLESVNEPTYTVVMQASGQDKRGQGAAKATIQSRVIEHDGGSRVEVLTDFTITGQLARLGRGAMMEDVATRLLQDFAICLEARIGADNRTEEPLSTVASYDDRAAPSPARSVSARLLLLSVFRGRIRRLLGRLLGRFG